MKYAIISDIHANESALRHVLADAQRKGAERIICLGDVVGYGPMPKEALALVRASCAETIAGNHDDAVSGRGDASTFIDLAADAVARHREALAPEDLAWLANLPYTCELEGAIAAHGDFFDPPKFYYVEDEKDAEANFQATDAQLMFVGHSHLPALFVVGRTNTVYRTDPQDFTLEDNKRYIVNPGSVGYPRESNGECFSSYVLYDSTEKTVCYRYIPFSVASVMQRGPNPKRIRKRIIAAIAVAAALVAALFTFIITPKPTLPAGANDAARIVATKTIPVEPDIRHVFANLVLQKGSDPVVLLVVYKDADGRELKSEPIPVKSRTRKGLSLPAGCRATEFRVLKTKAEDSPTIAEFSPAASVK